jgi:hypothetical protein
MEEVKAPPLSPNNLQLAEFVRTTHIAEIPPGVPFSSLLRPEFWTHCAKKFKTYSIVECRAQDNKWLADLMVSAVGEFGVSMWVKSFVDIEAQAQKAATSDAGYTVSFAARQRWRVIRNSDGAVVHKDCATEEEAKAWLDKSLTAA